MARPPITVLLPIRNGELYLPDAIHNIQNCIGPDDEILVIDDGSQDKTANILWDWCRQNLRVRVLKNPSSGLVSALNFGLSEASNTWVARFDVDDFYDHARFEKQFDLISPGVVAVFSDYALFHSQNRGLGTIYSGISHPAVSISLISSQRTAHSSILFNKEVVVSAGGYRESDFPAEDLSLWLRLSRLGMLVSVPETLLKYRVSKGSISSTKQDLMIKKKSEVLQQIKLNPSDVLLFENNFSSILQSYKLHPNHYERSILAYRDYFFLQASNIISAESVVLKKQFAQWLSIRPKAQFALAKLALEKAHRNHLR
jgi:glycosyltransferase involved in cell wall biosynthesis